MVYFKFFNFVNNETFLN